jgi:hypothetical protein
MVKCAYHEVPHHVIFSSLLLLPLTAKCSPQHSVVKSPQKTLVEMLHNNLTEVVSSLTCILNRLVPI